jgi:hypothetical protein
MRLSANDEGDKQTTVRAKKRTLRGRGAQVYVWPVSYPSPTSILGVS